MTGVGQIQDTAVPRTRRGFRTQLFERYKWNQVQLDEAICDVFAGEAVEGFTGSQPSPRAVSWVLRTLGWFFICLDHFLDIGRG